MVGGGAFCLRHFPGFCIVGKSNVCTAYVPRIVEAGGLVPWRRGQLSLILV